MSESCAIYAYPGDEIASKLVFTPADESKLTVKMEIPFSLIIVAVFSAPSNPLGLYAAALRIMVLTRELV